MSLSEIISTRIQRQGDLPFVDFMQVALYDPDFGYYSGGLQKFGSEGDFVTAPELTSLFAKTLANQCQQLFTLIEQPVLFEFGAGSGALCVDLLKELEQLNCLPTTYQILEVSQNLRQRQHALINKEIPHLASRVEWLDEWPAKAFSGVIIANEVLDAMPVHRFLQTENHLCEGFITLDSAGQLREVFKPCDNMRLLAHLHHVLPKTLFPYYSEANLFIENWLQQCSNMLTSGAMIIIDYGFPRHEYYHPDRNQGTLMCHHRHKTHSNPLLHIGEQDISAHVDFTHVAEAAVMAGFHVAGFTNQAAFLLANGLLSKLAEIDDESERLIAASAVKQLTLPNEMGELFKVIALTKNMDLSLTGFQLLDKRMSL